MSLDRIGLRFGIKQASDQRDLLSQHEEVIRSISDAITDVVLILGVDAVGTANTFAEYLPDASIHLLAVNPLDVAEGELADNVDYSYCSTVAERIRYLSTIPRPQLIIENGSNKKGQKLACFRDLFLFLPPGAVYVVEELKAITIAKLDDQAGENIVEMLTRLNLLRLTGGRQGDDLELARAIGSITFGHNVAYIRKSGSHLIKLRDADASEILDRRFGPRWGRDLLVRKRYRFESAATAISHGPGPIKDRTQVKVPKRFLRQYEHVVCQPRQRLIMDGYYLPDTFRHPLQSRLNHRTLMNSSPDLDRPRRDPPIVRRLEGSYFYFDTEYPGHFGHVMTEVLGRYWGWVEARKIVPDLKHLVSLDTGMDGLPEYQKLIFGALDIPLDDLAVIRWGESVEVDRLIAASPGFAQPHYAEQELAGVWSQVGEQLRLADHPTPPLIFATRKPSKIRTCLNADEVEGFFADLGFAVVYPERFSIAEQVTMFAQAKQIAGFGGSNLFNAMFSPGTSKIILSGESYTANNEQLISCVVGGDIHYFWGDSEIKHPTSGWTWDAFQSNFRFDVQRFGPEIRSLVAD